MHFRSKKIRTTKYGIETTSYIGSKLWNLVPTEYKAITSAVNLESALLGLRQFLATESPFKKVKNGFYFTLKILFVLMKFRFLSWIFGHVKNRFD